MKITKPMKLGLIMLIAINGVFGNGFEITADRPTIAYNFALSAHRIAANGTIVESWEESFQHKSDSEFQLRFPVLNTYAVYSFKVGLPLSEIAIELNGTVRKEDGAEPCQDSITMKQSKNGIFTLFCIVPLRIGEVLFQLRGQYHEN